MDSDQVARLVYLGVWGTVLISYFLIARQQNIGQTLRHALLWGLIFVGVAAGYGLWQDVTQSNRVSVTGDGAIVLRAARDGHFHLDLQINSEPVRFIIDTGASDLVLSRADAERVGLDPDTLAYLGQARTANGIVGLARVSLDDVILAHGDLEIHDTNVPAFVNEGQLDVSLLGMGYLRRYARISIEGERLILER
ncbi:retropepsin-like aspartic protease family protein [Roseinatronobacter alkalisoli]|uniref:TIGR02281 family clan AA aspartic protease n=1 Tax=Roseinatronobacter alkalisoli TaxID=3028235 RepID=A0ABT5T5D7_9RHOB|nr:TIGR02281 family clan AA aspartic protease [Roseinatronobacter sp. HJB301]MDD7970328.1 TIGR02281 family clan AA aspartic protease [Roseinatronobacter sp. HJB301]